MRDDDLRRNGEHFDGRQGIQGERKRKESPNSATNVLDVSPPS